MAYTPAPALQGRFSGGQAFSFAQQIAEQQKSETRGQELSRAMAEYYGWPSAPAMPTREGIAEFPAKAISKVGQVAGGIGRAIAPDTGTPWPQPDSGMDGRPTFPFDRTQLPGYGEPVTVATDLVGKMTDAASEWIGKEKVLNTPYQHVPLASGADPMYGAPISSTYGTSDIDIAQDVVDASRAEFYSNMDQQLDRIAGDLGITKERLAEDYGIVLDDLNDQLAKTGVARDRTNLAAGVNREEIDRIMGADFEMPAMPGQNIEERVTNVYDDAEGELRTTLARIDATGDPVLAEMMTRELRSFEQSVKDGLMTSVISTDQAYATASAYADALAKHAWYDSAYQAEDSRVRLEAQFEASIAEIEENIQDTKDAWALAQKRAAEDAARASDMVRDAQGNWVPDHREMWSETVRGWGAKMGLNEFEIDEMIGVYESIIENFNGGSFTEVGQMRSAVQTYVNQMNLDKLGLGQYVEQYVQGLQELIQAPDDALVDGALITDEMRADASLALDRYSKAMTSDWTPIVPDPGAFGLTNINPNDVNWDEIESISDPTYQRVVDMWSLESDFKENYAQIIANADPAVAASRGSFAPNNYENRFQPDYVYRREEWAPAFVEQVKSVFPFNVDVGGLGWMRPPTDVGGGKAANSDHQSGGAVDLYASTEDQRKQIAAWARAQPGVSYVIYEGNKYHEGDHVHVSLLIGYRP